MPWHSVGITVQDLADRGGRLHVEIEGRFVTVLQHKGTLYCVDSACHHASGPLGEGAVTDIEGIPCIKCPWHNFIFALDTGERVQQELIVPDKLPTGTFTPASQMQYPSQGWPPECLGPAKRTGTLAQRVHQVRVSGMHGELEVQIASPPEGKPYLSDKPSTDPKRGKMCITISENKAREAEAKASGKVDTGALPLSSAAEILFATPRSQMNRPKQPAASADDDDSAPPPDPRAMTPPPR